jgi:glutamate synthase (ferredoxin)
MTGGKVVILGSTGRNIGAGMTGGIAFILDENNDLSNKVNTEIVSIHKITSSKQEDILLEIIKEYQSKTNSLKAHQIIENWSGFKSDFKLIVPPSEEEMLGIKKM